MFFTIAETVNLLQGHTGQGGADLYGLLPKPVARAQGFGNSLLRPDPQFLLMVFSVSLSYRDR